MGNLITVGVAPVALVCAMLVVRWAIRTPDYDEVNADDREFD